MSLCMFEIQFTLTRNNIYSFVMELVQTSQKTLINTLIENIFNFQPWEILKDNLVEMNENDEVFEPEEKLHQQHQQFNKQKEKAVVAEQVKEKEEKTQQYTGEALCEVNEEMKLNQESASVIKNKEQQNKQSEHSSSYRNQFQQIPQTNKPQAAQIAVVQQRHHKTSSSRRKSSQDSINLQLTQKTKKQNKSNLPQQDSLMYSDATLMYSNNTGFEQKSTHKPLRVQSHKQRLNKIEDQEEKGDELDANIDRAVSREMDRMQTESNPPTQIRRETESITNNDQSRLPTQNPRSVKKTENEETSGNVFQTEINQYKSKLGRIREMKESKKRKLEAELRKVNQELDQLTKQQRQERQIHAHGSNNYQSRVRISDNIEALAKAERLVRGLRYEKKSRQQLHLGEIYMVDKNINGYMEELVKERHKNEELLKQRKKIQIIERMKQQQMRKIEDQKQKQRNLQFVHHLKHSNSKNAHSSPNKAAPSIVQPIPIPETHHSRQRLLSKKSEITESEMTPELSRKKAYLKRIRNVSFRKQKIDAYEQLLS